jgi:hypothetical protein
MGVFVHLTNASAFADNAIGSPPTCDLRLTPDCDMCFCVL